MAKNSQTISNRTRLSVGIAIGIVIGVAVSNSENITYAARISLGSLNGAITSLENTVDDIIFGAIQVGDAAVASSVPAVSFGGSASSVAGELRFNTSTGALEVGDGTEWRQLAYDLP